MIELDLATEMKILPILRKITIENYKRRLTPEIEDVELSQLAQAGIYGALLHGVGNIGINERETLSIVRFRDDSSRLYDTENQAIDERIISTFFTNVNFESVSPAPAQSLARAHRKMLNEFAKAMPEQASALRFITGTSTKKRRPAETFEKTFDADATNLVEATLDDAGHAPDFGHIPATSAQSFKDAFAIIKELNEELCGSSSDEFAYSISTARDNLKNGINRLADYLGLEWGGVWLEPHDAGIDSATADGQLKLAQAQAMQAQAQEFDARSEEEKAKAKEEEAKATATLA